MFLKQQTHGYSISPNVCFVEKKCALTSSDQMHHFGLLGHKTDEKISQMHIKEGTEPNLDIRDLDK